MNLKSQYQVETSFPGVFRKFISPVLQILDSDKYAVYNQNYLAPNEVGAELDTNKEYIWQPGEKLSEKIRKNIFVRIQVSRRQCFVDEPILVTYKLYSRLNSESVISKTPLLAGFSVFEMGRVDLDTVTTENVNGKSFSVRVLLKKQLIPLQSGSIELDPMEIQNTIHFIKAAGLSDSKGKSLNELLEQFSKEEKATPVVRSYLIRTEPLAIVVKPVPVASHPPDFSGLVGNFNIEAELSRKQLTANDTAVFTLRIKGRGYLRVLNSLAIHWPAGIEVYPPSVLESLDKSSFPMSGSKTFQYIISSKTIGIKTILPISLSYFNPSVNQYYTIQSSACSFEVLPATHKESLTIAPAASPDSGLTLHGLSHYPAISYIRDHAGWLTFVFSLICLILYLVLRNRKLQKEVTAQVPFAPAPDPPVSLQPEPIPNPLDPARELIENKEYEEFYREINRVIYQELRDKLEIPASALNKNNIQDLLGARGWTQEMVDRLNRVLFECEVRLYTPGQLQHDVRAILNEAEEVLNLIEKS